MNIVDRFIEYIKIDTCSMEESETHPSTMIQHDLAKLLYNQLSKWPIENLVYDKEHCYVYAQLPATKGYENKPRLGLIAHMDTSPAMSGTDVNPRIVKNYQGEDILLNSELGIVMKKAEFAELENYIGKDLIVTDGTTLLGADDKAGIAEIMQTVEELVNHPEIPHGRICIGFTPDEEIGQGPDFFDLEAFDADVAYTVDGGAIGEIEYENFNAAGAKVTFQGKSVHPGYAKGKMINSILLAQEFQNLLPVFQNPMYTEGYEGFYHLDEISGNVEKCVAQYIIRDHDEDKFEEKKKFFMEAAAFLQKKYGEECILVDLKDSYKNMKCIIDEHMELVDLAVETMLECGIEPKVVPIRGGTDGARLSFMGLPCPNLCTGGENFHGKYEYIPVQSMEVMCEYLIKLVQKFAV